MPLGVSVPGYAEVIPDLVVEVASPSDSSQSLKEKAMMWLDFGVPLVWVGHPDTRMVDVYLSSREVRTLSEEDTLDGGDVLPGFTCQVREIFDV